MDIRPHTLADLVFWPILVYREVSQEVQSWVSDYHQYRKEEKPYHEPPLRITYLIDHAFAKLRWRHQRHLPIESAISELENAVYAECKNNSAKTTPEDFPPAPKASKPKPRKPKPRK